MTRIRNQAWENLSISVPIILGVMSSETEGCSAPRWGNLHCQGVQKSPKTEESRLPQLIPQSNHQGSATNQSYELSSSAERHTLQSTCQFGCSMKSNGLIYTFTTSNAQISNLNGDIRRVWSLHYNRWTRVTLRFSLRALKLNFLMYKFGFCTSN